MEYVEAHSEENFGDYGSWGIKILVAAGRELDSDDRIVFYEVADKIQDAIRSRSIALDPRAQEQAAKERQELLNCFPAGELIYVKAISNRYCSRWCCKHLPWFEVTTRLGVIRIGWRKRVIHIDWLDSDIAQKSETLFAAENTTKDNRMIHAYGYGKAKEYLAALWACSVD